MTLLAPLAFFIGVALQGAALWLLIGAGPLLWVIGLHVIGALVAGFGAAILFPAPQRAAWWQPAAWALVFPVAGALAAVCVALILRRPPIDRSARRYIVWDDHAAEEWTAPAAGGAGQSIVQILQSPRTQLRRSAVLALRELDPQLALPLLRKGLQDSDEQVRIYAQNILSAMLERFEGRIKELEQRLDTSSIDAVSALRLAEQYFELVYLQVAGDEETSAHYLMKAQALLDRAFALTPEDAAIAFLGFKYALRARDVALAGTWLGRAENLQVNTQHLLPWRMELAFLQADWPRLKTLFTEFNRAQAVNPRIEELGEFWFGRRITET